MFKAYELFALAGILAPAVWLGTQIDDPVIRADLTWAGVSGILCFVLTVWIVPSAAAYLLRRGLKGLDLGKKGTAAGRIEMCVYCRRCSCFRRLYFLFPSRVRLNLCAAVTFSSANVPALLQSVSARTRLWRCLYERDYPYSAVSSSRHCSAGQLQRCSIINLSDGFVRLA
jgi:hypothetical protein